MFVILGFIREPLIFSIRTNNNCPPSNAGNGIKLRTARFIEIRAVKDNK